MYIAALDIGGTKTIVAILDENGGILIQESFPSIVARYETHLELCVQAMKRLMHRTELQAEDFTGLGVSLPGIVDNDIVNIGLHFFLKDVRSMLPPVMNHSIAYA